MYYPVKHDIKFQPIRTWYDLSFCTVIWAFLSVVRRYLVTQTRTTELVFTTVALTTHIITHKLVSMGLGCYGRSRVVVFLSNQKTDKLLILVFPWQPINNHISNLIFCAILAGFLHFALIAITVLNYSQCYLFLPN